MVNNTNFQQVLDTITNYYEACFTLGHEPNDKLSLGKMLEETKKFEKKLRPNNNYRRK